jgi:AraC-like DNA-binding protein
MEVLSDILNSMRVQGSVYFCDSLKPPWSKDYPNLEQPSFHLVRRGDCWIMSDDLVERLGPGDLVFITANRDYTIASSAPGAPAYNNQSETLLLCGYCEFDALLDHPLIKALPSLTIVRAEEFVDHPWLKSTLDQLSAEYLSQQPGSEIVINKLTEVVIVELVRIDFGRSEKNTFIGALYDKQISAGLALMHAEPHKPWTLETLAAEAALSRSSFARRFKERVGQPMFEYLTALRMQRASELLRDTNLSIYEVASRVGYDSDVAFTKAFKRIVRTTPTRYRKSAHPAVARLQE